MTIEITGTVKTARNGKVVIVSKDDDLARHARDYKGEIVTVDGAEYNITGAGQKFWVKDGSFGAWMVYLYTDATAAPFAAPSPQGRASAARRFDAVINEGGEGFNPYR